jgi:hypothetical protein
MRVNQQCFARRRDPFSRLIEIALAAQLQSAYARCDWENVVIST